MPIASKPFGEKAIGLLSGPFHRARVRLTFTYVAILAIVLGASSGSIYSAFSKQLEHRFERFRPHTPLVLPEGMVPPNSDDVRADLIKALLCVNGFLLLIGGVFSYYLASLTLEPIQNAYDQQRRFLSDASHELRTPLAILQTDLENQQGNRNLSEEIREQTESHLEEVRRMGRLVGDLLMLSRLDEQEKRAVQLEDLALTPIIVTAVQRLQGVANEQGVTLSLEATGMDEVRVPVNVDLFLRVLMNLLQNAILYNKPSGNVRVILTTDAQRAKVDICDTGVGIAPPDLEKIFERFYRTDKSRSRQTGGSGLGLSIVQALLQQMNGTIEIKSMVGEGTTVTLFLPLSKAS